MKVPSLFDISAKKILKEYELPEEVIGRIAPPKIYVLIFRKRGEHILNTAVGFYSTLENAIESLFKLFFENSFKSIWDSNPHSDLYLVLDGKHIANYYILERFVDNDKKNNEIFTFYCLLEKNLVKYTIHDFEYLQDVPFSNTYSDFMRNNKIYKNGDERKKMLCEHHQDFIWNMDSGSQFFKNLLQKYIEYENKKL